MKRLLACSFAVLFAASTCRAGDPPKTEEIEIKVLAILASEKHTDIHPRLVEFAKLVQAKESKLTGFKIDRSTKKDLTLGQTQEFPLVNDEVVEVTVNKERNE